MGLPMVGRSPFVLDDPRQYLYFLDGSKYHHCLFDGFVYVLSIPDDVKMRCFSYDSLALFLMTHYPLLYKELFFNYF